MVEALGSDVKFLVLSDTSFGPVEIDQLVSAINDDALQFSALRDAVAELEQREGLAPATLVRLGVCYCLQGKYRLACDTLSSADGSALALFYLGRSHFALERYAEAITAYKGARLSGYNDGEVAVAIAEAQRYGGESAAAMETLDSLSGAVEQTAEYLYQRATTVGSLHGNPTEVCALLERAVSADEYHPGALFGLAMENDRRGNDGEAFRLYQRAALRFPSHVGALLNLGLMYEDQDEYPKAQQCYQRILESYPAEPRALIYAKDANASGDMYYDEEAQKKRDRLAQVLSVSVSDFELSVRSRNCLQKMGVDTLGDLTRTSEPELLASKNFGETSLVEIREMLHSKGLELGQFSGDMPEAEAVIDTSNMSPDEQALMDRPISDLNLSVRARKCMVRLGLNTIGELLRKTADDLLECKNFGVTSLTEVREKLTIQDMSLRGE